MAPTERASSTSPAGSSRYPVAYWTWLTQMTDVRSSTAAAIVSSENEAGSWSAGASRTSTPVSRASRSQGYVTLGNSRSAETTFSPSPGFSHQATWQSASVACVTTATSSGVAPRSRAAAALGTSPTRFSTSSSKPTVPRPAIWLPSASPACCTGSGSSPYEPVFR